MVMGYWEGKPGSEFLSNQSPFPSAIHVTPLEGMLSVSKKSYQADVQ